MVQDLMKQKIIAYINITWQWHQTGNGLLTEGIGLQMADLEGEILTGFGLPYLAFQYSEILQLEGFSKVNIKKRADALMQRLSEEATTFLLSPIEMDETALRNSKQRLQDGVEVLPMIGLSTTHYNLFLYYDFYFRNLLNEQELLQHLRKAEAMDQQVETRIPFTYQTLQNGNHTKRLTKAGLSFVKEYGQYLKYCVTNQKWDNNGFQENKVKANAPLNDNFELNHFFITYMCAINKETAVIEILLSINKVFTSLRIWCTIEMVQQMLLHSIYYSLAIPSMYILNPKYLRNGEMHLRLKDAGYKNIEINNIVIGVERGKDGPNEIPYYNVKYIKPTVTFSPGFNTNQIDGLPF